MWAFDTPQGAPILAPVLRLPLLAATDRCTLSPVNSPPGKKSRRVKATFLGPFAIALCFIMAVFAASFYLVEIRVRDRDLAERSAAVAKLFAQKLDKDTHKMMSTLRALMINQAIEEAFRLRDRGALAQQGGELFRSLNAEHKITHLYFIRPDLVSLYRFHSPAVFGDEIQRVTMQQAREGQKTSHGLELGPMGTLTLRLVTPWRQSGELLGYLEIGEEIEHLLDEIRLSLGIDLLVLADKHYLTPGQWRRGLDLMQRSGDWERFGSHAVLAQTAEQIPAALDERLLRQLLAGGTAEIRDHGRSIHLASVPITDAGKLHLGDLVVMRDITALESTFQWSMVAVILISLLAAGGVLGVFYLALERVERDYRRQHDLEHQLLRLDSEHRRILQLEKLSAVGTMVGGIAHQLNNPLVGVVNLAQLAEREADDPARTRELLREIRRGLPRLRQAHAGLLQGVLLREQADRHGRADRGHGAAVSPGREPASAGGGEAARRNGGADGRPRPDPPCAVQPARQCGAGDAGRGGRHRDQPRSRDGQGTEPARLDAVGHGPRPWHGAGGHGKGVRALLHHAQRRHRPRPAGGAACRAAARWPVERQQRAGAWHTNCSLVT